MLVDWFDEAGNDGLAEQLLEEGFDLGLLEMKGGEEMSVERTVLGEVRSDVADVEVGHWLVV